MKTKNDIYLYLFRSKDDITNEIVLGEKYNTTYDDVWYFAPRFSYKSPFKINICLIWTPPEIPSKFKDWSILVRYSSTHVAGGLP